MNKGWDSMLPDPEVWRECLRILKPGGVLMAFGGSRTYHRLVCNLEDAGYELEDCIFWIHGQGFPKGKARLKPACEPIALCRKPGGVKWLGIEECRIGVNRGCRSDQGGLGIPDAQSCYGDGLNRQRSPEVPNLGRWPAHLVLSHTPSCMKVGMKKVKSSSVEGHIKPANSGTWETRGKKACGGRCSQDRPS